MLLALSSLMSKLILITYLRVTHEKNIKYEKNYTISITQESTTNTWSKSSMRDATARRTLGTFDVTITIEQALGVCQWKGPTK